MSYLALQGTYDVFEMALVSNNTIIDVVKHDKRLTSTLFIPLLEQLLSKHALSLAELSFCAVNCGPGPFSTLRSIIASVNGLHLATNIPLISIDGLTATFLEFYDKSYQHTIVLLNAFNNESYYLIADGNQIVATGYKKTDMLRQEIQEQFPDNNVHIIDNKICSLETIGRLGYEKFMTQGPESGYLVPLHLKKHPVEEREK